MNINDMEGVPKKELHIFYLLDTSGSMTGAPIGALNDSMRDTVRELADLSRSSNDASFKIAVMEYNSTVRWVTMGNNGLEDIEDFIWTDLDAGGVTSLGAALRDLNSQLSRNAMQKSATGNKRPVVVLMSDGFPNDDWADALDELWKNRWYQQAIKGAFAMGDNADVGVLGKVVGGSEAVLRTSNLSVFRKLMRVVSVSASLASSVSRLEDTERTGADIVSEVLGTTQSVGGVINDIQDVFGEDSLYGVGDIDFDDQKDFN